MSQNDTGAANGAAPSSADAEREKMRQDAARSLRLAAVLMCVAAEKMDAAAGELPSCDERARLEYEHISHTLHDLYFTAESLLGAISDAT